ncbi:cell division protein ZipA [Ferrimonas lipolytica]|uniref:Cell division protein ZipA n=1 Tax=Ferrimonas lipolytica TaxID=2724191 RepID=A0A6H1UE50_9GAMM|nr:cell division protein ZipA [Ferrimonas lipolytica]QIZ76870.1 cell division protein ZipA [Ferrimonas lipolytica]
MRIVFLVVGTIAIVGLMVHGFWSVQKKKPKAQNRRTASTKSKKAVPRVAPEPQIEEPELVPIRAVEPDPVVAQPAQQSLLAEELAPTPEPPVKVARPRAASPVRHEPSLGQDQIELGLEPAPAVTPVQPEVVIVEEQPPIVAKAQPEPESEHELPTFHSAVVAPPEQPVQPESSVKTEPAFQHDLEPEVEQRAEEQVELTLEPEPMFIETPEPQVEVAEPEPQDPTDVLVLYVVGKDGSQIMGEELLPNLTSMGFKFGDMDIFHRHQHTNGRGPVQYSLANMLQPGTFDLDTMEQFSTEGVLLFLTLPTKNDARVAFSMMLGNAKGLADFHGGQVLDDQRNVWNDASQERYMQRIQAAESTQSA